MKKNGQGNAPKNGAGRTENPQERFLLAGVGVFLKHGELSQMTVQNDYGAILVARTSPNAKTVTRAIGFNADFDDEDDEDGEDGEEYEDDGDDEDEESYNAFVERHVRWLA